MHGSAEHIAGRTAASPILQLSSLNQRRFRSRSNRAAQWSLVQIHRRKFSLERSKCGAVSDRLLESEGVEESSIPKSPYNGKTAIVVGAGPSGSMAGMLLAKRGFNVKIFEKRSNPQDVPMSDHRSIPNVLNPEVTRYLSELGVGVATSESEDGLPKLQDFYLTTPNGGLFSSGIFSDGSRRILSERHAIAGSILEMGLSSELPNLDYTFNAKCEDVDISTKTVRFLTQGDETIEVKYDLLIGADGVHSKVREALQALGHLKFTQKKSLRRNISVRNLPMPKDASKDFFENLSLGCIAFGPWRLIGETSMRVVVYKSKNGYFQLMFSGSDESWMDRIKGKELEVIADVAPDWVPKEWFGPIAEQIRNKDAFGIGPVTYCSSFIGPDAVLIGDACHSATPTLGYGSNRAILDARDLDEALGNAEGNISKAIHDYDEKCRPLIAATQQLEMFHPETQLEGRPSLWAAFFPLYMKFHMYGRKILPGLVPKNAYLLLLGSMINPVEALQRYKTFAIISTGGAATLISACLLFFLKLV